jgi:hypothetical protein
MNDVQANALTTTHNARRRIEDQDRIASEKGFAFREQTLYAWGTEMLNSGKSAVQARRRKLENQPFAHELHGVADEIARREQRKDYTVDLTKLKIDALSGVLRERPEAVGVLRTRLEGTNGSAVRGCYAAVSPKYKPYDVPDALRDIAHAVDPSGRAQLRYDGRRWSVTITYFVPYEPVVGDVQHGFVKVWSADDGSDSVHFQAGLFRIRCLNATLIPALQTLEPVRHTRREMVELIRERISDSFDRVQPFAEAFGEASRTSIIDGVYEGIDPKTIFGALADKGLIHAVGASTEELVGRCVRAWQLEPGYQRSDIVNAITRATALEYGRRAPKSVCQCGHTGDGAASEHADTALAVLGMQVKGHGRCLVPGCACERFTWGRFNDVFQAALKRVG